MSPLRTPQSWTRPITIPSPNNNEAAHNNNPPSATNSNTATTTITYTISTDPDLIQTEAIQTAFASDMIYWARPFDEEELRVCLRTSLCMGLYVHEGESLEEGGQQDDDQKLEDQKQQQANPNPPRTEATQQNNTASQTPAAPSLKMIGLSRLVTDTVTFAYLTDVYVLPAHQGRGLARWMMACLDEILTSWPNLRRCLLFTSGESAVRLYTETLGAREVVSAGSGGGEKGGLVIMERTGPGKVFA